MRYIEGKFQGRSGLKLYNQAWLPDHNWKAVLVVVHGLADHSGRYMNLVNYLVPKGYAIFSFDQRGHGKSQGCRGYVERFLYYLDDLSAFIDKVHTDHNDIPVFLFGHSLGGTIAATYTADHQTKLAELILSFSFIKARLECFKT
jgi:acylglycerol lipase